MADPTPKDQNPIIKQFRSKLANGSAGPGDRGQLEKFRNGPKCTPELHAVVDGLLAEFDAKAESMRVAQAAAHARVHAPAAAHSNGPVAKGVNATAAAPAALGEPFHNPYTFLPFGSAPKRRVPTLQSADEVERERFTGLLRIKLKTLSPLLTCEPKPEEGETHRVLAIDNDVVVPSSGVRGTLRTLLTILTGGTLGYVDPTLWLTQGRDLNLGPRGKTDPLSTPERVFLARVVEPGSPTRPGIVEIGALAEPLIKVEDLGRIVQRLDEQRPKQGKRRGVIEIGGSTFRLSGAPVNWKGKREGQFQPSGIMVSLPPERWAEYQGRHAHAEFSDLRRDDLVWLEPSSPSLRQITRPEDVASIQWARWGRKGQSMIDTIRKHHKAVVPDALRSDGLVDEVTDLFGQVPDARSPGAALAFAARVRPDNLVFRDALKGQVERDVQLAPMMQPHPGCLGFYRDNRDTDALSMTDPLRGYKVYRTTAERGPGAPWHYSTQPVFNERGEAKAASPRLTKKVDLLKENAIGEVTLSLRSLSRRELALLLAACSVDWRLGGGKPLGLGHCRVLDVELVDESGTSRLRWSPSPSDAALDRAEPGGLPEGYRGDVADLGERIFAYQATQRPVRRLRYPRAAEWNANKTSRGGNVWFKNHATPSKTGDRQSDERRGLTVLRAKGALAQRLGRQQIAAQPLPTFNPKDPFSDVLYGYDLIATVVTEDRKPREIVQLEPFDPARHGRADDRSGPNTSPSAATRRLDREQR